MTPLIGYADKLSVRAGETIRFHVACASGKPVTSKLVRVICADPNPAGPGIIEEPVGVGVVEVQAPGAERTLQGSYAIVPPSEAIRALNSFTMIATAWIGGNGTPGAIMALGDHRTAATRATIQAATLGHGMSFAACLGQGNDEPLVLTSNPIETEQWYTIVLTYDAAAATANLTSIPLHGAKPADVVEIMAPVPVTLGSAGAVRIGGGLPDAVAGTPTAPFTGRIERPMIFNTALSPSDFNNPPPGQPPSLVAAWDFSRDIPTSRIIDVGPNGLHGQLINQPTRAVAGSSWNGSEMCWRHDPRQYRAIHFHADDIDDCRWPVTHEWTVPAGTRSAAYALRLESDGVRENIPFFVVPPKGKPASRVAVLVSTFTYTVYGNHARPEWFNDDKWKAAWIAQAEEWNAYPHNPGDHLDLGLSTYNFHTDGSGIAYASWHRPMFNVRSGYITYPYDDIRGSGLRHYPADSHLTAWLEAKGQDYDIITDWELHHEGYELLKNYQVVTTGSHPEYHTREMLDALTQYRDRGGRFMYLGGNGFYWKIALSPEKPGVIEIRRGEGGIRAWAADPGEYYNAFDGEYGGLGRRNGRAPQKLAGVGFTAQGNFVGSYYRLTPEAADPRVAWMLQGVDGDIIGDFGLSGHGAAGFELDRTDKRLGTPLNATVIAKSENHPADAPWVLVPEEQLTHLTTIPGGKPKDLIRADMTFFETAGGKGAVFSTGSITFCGSLPHNKFDNNVSTLLGNVLERFLDPTPFDAPA